MQFQTFRLVSKGHPCWEEIPESGYDPGFSLFRERKLLSKMTFMLYNSGVEICATNWTYMSIAFLLKILNLSLNKTVTEGGILGEGHILFCLLKHLFNFTHHQAIVLLPVFSQVPLQSPGSPSSQRGEAWVRHGGCFTLLSTFSSVRCGAGNGFEGAKAASLHMGGAKAKLGLRGAALFCMVQNEGQLNIHSHFRKSENQRKL